MVNRNHYVIVSAVTAALAFGWFLAITVQVPGLELSLLRILAAGLFLLGLNEHR
jgi:hypothetical protein